MSSFGHFMWSLVVIFFMIIYFMILFNILSDLFRSHDIGGVVKTLWVVAILFVPLVSMLVYLIVRGNGMADRAIASQRQMQEQTVQTARGIVAQTDGSPAASAGAAQQIAQAKGLLDSGAITQAEFDALKAKALA